MMTLEAAAEIFGLTPNSLPTQTETSLQILRKALVLKHHPDKGGMHEIFIKINPAYAALLAHIQQPQQAAAPSHATAAPSPAAKASPLSSANERLLSAIINPRPQCEIKKLIPWIHNSEVAKAALDRCIQGLERVRMGHRLACSPTGKDLSLKLSTLWERISYLENISTSPNPFETNACLCAHHRELITTLLNDLKRQSPQAKPCAQSLPCIICDKNPRVLGGLYCGLNMCVLMQPVAATTQHGEPPRKRAKLEIYCSVCNQITTGGPLCDMCLFTAAGMQPPTVPRTNCRCGQPSLPGGPFCGLTMCLLQQPNSQANEFDPGSMTQCTRCHAIKLPHLLCWKCGQL